MAYKDNSNKKKSRFEMITMIVVIIMLIATVGSLVLAAISAVL